MNIIFCILNLIHYFWVIFLKKIENICLEIYQLEPVNFFSGPRLGWEAALKKTEVKLELLSDIDMLLIVEKEVRGKICHSINRLIDMQLIHTINKEPSFVL